MAATTKLIVWNAALRELAAAPLADTTSANTRQFELNGAWDHAIENVLALEDWSFARRRAQLSTVADTSFPPYTYRAAKPSDYLRKCWLKDTAETEHQVDHAEIAAVFYTLQNSALLEYMSDHADNYDPANWPPHFTKVLTLHLAALVGPRVARAGADDLGRLNAQMSEALEDAKGKEALFLTNAALASNRQPVFRRAIEFIGQQLAGSVPIHAHADMMRWHMNRAFSHAVQYVLERGAWNFATQRVIFRDGLDGDSVVPSSDGDSVIEGYSVAPAVDDEEDDTSLSGFDYAFAMPSDFLHKIWIKASATSTFEIEHQFMGAYVFVNTDPCVMEYVAESSYATNPENWSANFLEAVAAYLAVLVTPEIVVEMGAKGALKVNANQIRTKLEQVFEMKLSDAKLRDAIQQQMKPLPPGSWSMARRGARTF